MKGINDKSIDMILCDLPYGTTRCKWDVIIPFKSLWAQYKRIIKDRGAVVLTATQPFTSTLVMSNIEMFKYEWIWDKVRGVGFQVAKYRPLMRHESVLVFGKGRTTYNPQMVKRDKVKRSKNYSASDSSPLASYDEKVREYTHRYPTSIQVFSHASQKGRVHPTQKPVELFEYLIRTYSSQGDLILDNCAGSGTTGVACLELDRNFILIELDPKYCKIALERISRKLMLKNLKRRKNNEQ